MPQPTPKEIRQARQERFQGILNDLAAKGLTQAEIAQRLSVPPSYLSDVKNGYRTLTELFARRVSEEFGVDYMWLLHGTGSGEKPSASVTSSPDAQMLLPVVGTPCLGDPAVSATAEGILVAISGPARVAAAQASIPYLLRLGQGLKAEGLREGDILLMSQEAGGEGHAIVVLQSGKPKDSETGPLRLARRKGEKGFADPSSGRTLRGSVQVVGCCLGVVWRAM